jgi:hypothetical protein
MTVRIYKQILFFINWMNTLLHLLSHIVWVGRFIVN